MIRINLLPFRSTRKKENIRRQLSIFVLSLILAVVAYFSFWAGGWMRRDQGLAREMKIQRFQRIHRDHFQVWHQSCFRRITFRDKNLMKSGLARHCCHGQHAPRVTHFRPTAPAPQFRGRGQGEGQRR